MEFIPPVMESAKSSQGKYPQSRCNMNGVEFVELEAPLKPIVKTNHIEAMKASGRIMAQKTPKNEPRY